MDAQLKIQCEELRQKDSQRAADWLMSNYPVENVEYGNAIILMSHRSWKKIDQVRLAKYYLRKLPFSNGKIYEVFLSFMSVESFLKVIKEYLPTEKSDVMLLIYYLEPILKKSAKSGSDSELIRTFMLDVISFV